MTKPFKIYTKKIHTVKLNENLGGISTKYYNTVRRIDIIKLANPNLKTSGEIEVGQKLVIFNIKIESVIFEDDKGTMLFLRQEKHF